MQYLFLFLLVAFRFPSCAQLTGGEKIQPLIETLSFPLGNDSLVLKKYTYDAPRPYIFLQLHDNEATAEAAAQQYLQRWGGVLVSVENGGERNVRFVLDTATYTFDPNRIFTPQGLKATLERFGASSPEAIAAVEALAQSILQQLSDTALIVALHNNTDDAFSAASYRNDTSYQKDAAAVYINEVEDVDDFFLTTSQLIYQQLAGLQYNVVWQHNQNAADDGSLSVYYGKKGVRYVNVEAQHGHQRGQLKMIEALLNEVK